MKSPYQFFFEHAGFSYDPATETPQQGRARCAKALAAAEKNARESGTSFEWSIDPDVTAADMIENVRRNNDYSLWQCVARDETGDVRASLHGIDFGPDGEPWGDPYRRVVESELASEFL